MSKRFSKKNNKINDPLVNALDSFNATLSDLGSSYQELMERIRELNTQISEKNQQLEENFYEANRLRRFLNAILNSIADGVVVIDTGGKIVLFNRSAENLTDFSGEEVIGKLYTKVFGKHVSERFSPLYTLTSGVSLLSEEKEIVTKSGKHLPVRYSTSLVTDSQERTLGAVEVFSDLTRIKELEKEMQVIKTQAALNQMVGLVAHEIRNPLGGIRGYVDLLAESMEENDPRRKMVDHIIESIVRLDEIVANFHFYTRPVEPHFVEMDLKTFLRDVLNFFEQKAHIESKSIRLVSNLGSEKEPVKLRIDPVLLEQAVLAVLDNGVKAMKNGGTLRVELQEEKSPGENTRENVSIIITDSGEGMSREVIEKLFTPFFTTRERGLGLGLSLAQNFVSLHRGNIFVDSEKGMGSTVTIVLPKNLGSNIKHA